MRVPGQVGCVVEQCLEVGKGEGPEEAVPVATGPPKLGILAT